MNKRLDNKCKRINQMTEDECCSSPKSYRPRRLFVESVITKCNNLLLTNQKLNITKYSIEKLFKKMIVTKVSLFHNL
jgi:hypothetical protein